MPSPALRHSGAFHDVRIQVRALRLERPVGKFAFPRLRSSKTRCTIFDRIVVYFGVDKALPLLPRRSLTSPDAAHTEKWAKVIRAGNIKPE
jgi:hypothetical protein